MGEVDHRTFLERREARPPELCSACRTAPATPYARFIREKPDLIMGLRKGIRMFKAGSVLFRAGDMASEVYIMYSGWAAEFGSAGRSSVITEFRLDGECINPSTALGYQIPVLGEIRALTDLAVCVFPAEGTTFLLQQHSELADGVHERRDRALQRMFSKAAEFAGLTAECRLARIVTDLYARAARANLVKDDAFSFPVTRAQFAEAIGTTVVHLNRLLPSLYERGLLQFESRHLHLLDHEALKVMAEGR